MKNQFFKSRDVLLIHGHILLGKARKECIVT
jgi:hypothetical protein